MTTSAAGLVDLYSIQKPGMDVDVENDVNTSGTGTVTNTETGSGILTDNEGKIKGIVLDKEIVEAEKGIEETLTAEIIVDGDLVVKGEDGKDIELSQEEALRKLSEKITWRLGRLDANGSFVKDNSLSSTLGTWIDPGEDSNNPNVDRRTLTLVPKRGTSAGKDIYIEASLNTSWYIDKDGNVNKYENDLGEVKALAKVSIKEYTNTLSWAWEKEGSAVKEPEPYVNRKIDLSKYLVRDPETANDKITWVSSNTKVAAVTTEGVVTIRKANESFTVYAMGERCKRLAWTVKETKVGVPASKVEIWSAEDNSTLIKDPLLVDVGADGKNEGKEIRVVAKLYANKKVVLGTDGKPATTEEAANAAKDKNGGKYKVANKTICEKDYFIEANSARTELIKPDGAESCVQTLVITDDVVWNSTKIGSADVEVDPASDRSAVIKVSKDAQVGSANITAKTPKCSSKKVTVKVSATLIDLKITNDPVKDKILYSGQTLQMTYERTPKGNKDSIKWDIDKVNGQKNTNATINSKGLLTIKPTVKDGATVTVLLKSPKKGTRPEITIPFDITVKQSSIDGISIFETNPGSQKVAVVGLDNKGRVKQLEKAKTTNLDIPENGRYVVDVTLGENGNSDLTKEIALNTLTYKNSKPKVAEITRSGDGKLTITPKMTGITKITVSGVRATKNKGKVTGSAISTSFSVKVSQPVTSVSLSKPSIVLIEKRDKKGELQDLKFSSLKATFGPKKANKASDKKIEKWEIKKSTDAEWSTITKSKTNLAKNTSTSLSYTLTKPKAGETYDVRVTTVGGLTKTSTVTIVSPVTELAISKVPVSETVSAPDSYVDGNKKDQCKIDIGETITMYPCINIAKKGDAPIWKNAGEGEADFLADSIVSYSTNRKDIVSINQKTGVVKAMKNGKVTITAKAASGKTKKLTVIVELPKPTE